MSIQFDSSYNSIIILILFIQIKKEKIQTKKNLNNLERKKISFNPYISICHNEIKAEYHELK